MLLLPEFRWAGRGKEGMRRQGGGEEALLIQGEQLEASRREGLRLVGLTIRHDDNDPR